MRWLTITERFTIIGMYNEGQNMRKALCGFLSILAVFGVVCFFSGQSYEHKKQFAVISCVSERTAASAADAAVVRGMEDMRMQVVYQLAKRSVVKLIVKDAAASGIIWKIEDGIVIVSNRHLLMKDVKAQVVFGNGETFAAEVAGYSQQYDIGFARIPEESVTNSVLREIYEAVPVLYEAETESAKAEFGQKYLEKRVAVGRSMFFNWKHQGTDVYAPVQHNRLGDGLFFESRHVRGRRVRGGRNASWNDIWRSGARGRHRAGGRNHIQHSARADCGGV